MAVVRAWSGGGRASAAMRLALLAATVSRGLEGLIRRWQPGDLGQFRVRRGMPAPFVSPVSEV